MNAADVIAYTADADVWCPRCAREAYGAAACGRCPKCNAFIYPDCKAEGRRCGRCDFDYSGEPMTDGERSPLGAIFGDAECPEGLHCGHCREEILPPSE